MNNEEDPKKNTQKGASKILIILLVAIAFLFLLWAIVRVVASRTDRADNDEAAASQSQSSGQQPVESGQSPIRDLITYEIPADWRELSCEGSDAVYILPPGEEDMRCDINPDAPISIVIDDKKTNDCNQLQDVQFVSRHVCKSIFVDGMKTLEASTTYNDQSSFSAVTTFDTYYMDTGNGIIKFQYMYRGELDSGSAAADFKQFVTGVTKAG